MNSPTITDVAIAPPEALMRYQSALEGVVNNPNLMSTHISLFTAMFVSWQLCGYAYPFNINRRQLMSFAKITSIATYHKCIRELGNLGYINYQPSFHPKLGSLIDWQKT